MTIQELVKIINNRYENDCIHISSIIEDIDDYIFEGEIPSNIEVNVVTCEDEEVERHYHELVAVDTFDAREWAKNPSEKSGVFISAEWNEADNTLDIWFIPNVSSEHYYGIDD